MQRYYNLQEFRKQVNKLYEQIKILQIFVEETVEDIQETIVEKLCDIIELIEVCLEQHSKLRWDVLKPDDATSKRKKIVNFNDIEISLNEMLTCIYFLKLAVEKTYKLIQYSEIHDMLGIVLKQSANVINLANKTKVKIYPSEKSKTKSSVKDMNFSNQQIPNRNIIRIISDKS